MYSTIRIFLILFFNKYCLQVMGDTSLTKEDVNPAINKTIHEITMKIDKIASNLLAQISEKNRSYVLSNFENKLLQVAENLGLKETKPVQLIMEEIKFKLLNGTENKHTSTEKIKRIELDNLQHNDQHEMVSELPNGINSYPENYINTLNISKNSRNPSNFVTEEYNKLLTNFLHLNDSRRMAERNFSADFINSLENNLVDESASKLVNNMHTYKTSKQNMNTMTCREINDRTCEDVKNMNRLKCKYSDPYITLDKLCDGTFDCPLKSDESDCYSQAMEKYFYVNQVIMNIESGKLLKCYSDSTKYVLSKQVKALKDLLAKITNVKTSSLINSLNKRNFTVQMNSNNKTIQENKIALAISSFAHILDIALCPNDFDLHLRRANDLFDIDLEKEFEEIVGSSKNCKCKQEFCLNCTHACERLCRQQYSLTKWSCESINATAVISLNSLCDGILDCFDESDEKECAGQGDEQFEAYEMFTNIIKNLDLKASNQTKPIKKNILKLRDSIKKLQELTVNSIPKLEVIKKLRDKCYSMLRTIYSDIVKQTDVGVESEVWYLFLLSINQNLGKALKSSHTGNKKIISDECQCRNGKCVSFCSKICAKACAVEPKLTRYNCRKTNESVLMKNICDGVQDCSDGYDESDCKTDEICRRHHLVLLRYNLEKIGENLKGTALGELISSWKLKVISYLHVLEKNDRPTPQMLKKVIQNIITDLVLTYGSVENFRRRANYTLDYFLNISQLIMETVKSCGK